MTNRALMSNVPDSFNHPMRRYTGGFVYRQDAMVRHE
jgi:hypothetical protein